MDEAVLKEQEEIIELMKQSYSEEDILSVSRKIGVPQSEFWASGLTTGRLANDLVSRAYQLNKGQLLKKVISERPNMFEMKINISDKSAVKFSRVLNKFLEKLSDIGEKDFQESDLFEPIQFEEKMRNKAKLSEDIIMQGVMLKSDITVLRRKANAFDYSQYKNLIQKLATYYIYTICVKYPVNEYAANRRFAELRLALLEMISDELYYNDDDIETYVDGIIFDTISKCLIFNE